MPKHSVRKSGLKSREYFENERAKKGDWKKAREILSKAPETEAEDFDKL